MNGQNKLELGAEATNFLNALRSFEAARNYYYEALEGEFGEEGASQRDKRELSTWQAAADLIENALMDHFRDWACEVEQRSTI